MSEKLPEIVTPLPGPKARAVVEADARWVSPSYTRSYPLVADHGSGATVTDVDGNRFLDFNAGIAVCSTGHAHPEVVRAIRDQAGRLIHMSGTDYYYRLMPELAAQVAGFMPYGTNWKTYFANSGTEAIEAAIKLARYHTRRPNLIAFHNAFHGRTYGALSLTASKPVQKTRFGSLLAGVTHVPFPDPYRDGDAAGSEVLAHIRKRVFKLLDPAEVAAIVVEPVQGEGGYVFPPRDFFRDLQSLAREHGILIVADEVQSGAGRTGRMFAFEHFGFEPDIIALAKGIASGMPLGLTLAQSRVMDWGPGAHASTFGGNPLSLRAAAVTFELIRDRYRENAARMGAVLLDGLSALSARYAGVDNVRGLGLMVAFEFVTDRGTRKPDPDLRDRVIQACFQRGLILLGAGPSTIRLSPPLVVDEDQCRAALEILDGAIAATVSG